MKAIYLKQSLLLATAIIGGLTGTVQAQSTHNEEGVVKLDSRIRNSRPGEIIVKFKPEAAMASPGKRTASARVFGAGKVNELLQKYQVKSVTPLMPLTGGQVRLKRSKALNGQDVADCDMSRIYCLALSNEEPRDIQEVIEEFKALDEVEFAEPNYLVYAMQTEGEPGDASAASYNDPLYPMQWGAAAIKADKLQDVPTLTDKRPVIAILDTGVDTDHPDLKDNIWTNGAEAEGSEGNDDDGNGFSDDLHGWDFVNETGIVRDYNGHGTHCAGIAAAVADNGIGIAGANPDALIMPVTVMQSDGVGDVATIIKGIDYAVANGADVISMSFGGYGYSLAEEQALGKAYQKAVLVAAAGNDAKCIYPHKCGVNIGSPMFPAAFSFVLGVQATGVAGLPAAFSNYDEDGPIYFNPEYFGEAQMYNYELKAPGVNILSTYPDGQYKALNGTSMACPLVAGAVSRLLQTKEYASKEILFGDLIHTAQGNVDAWAAYNLTDADRIPNLSFVSYTMEDGKDHDNRYDSGEEIALYPILRNDWGHAKNIKMWLTLGEFEDTSLITFLDQEPVAFGTTLSSYAKATGTNPLRFRISDKCVDGRRIKLQLHATCDNIAEELVYDFTISVENGVEIGGMIEKDMTLYPDVSYIVTNTIAIPEGVTLTIKPGTTLKFKDETGISVGEGGHLIAEGNADSLITFTSTNKELAKIQINLHETSVEYLKVYNILTYGVGICNAHFKHSIIENCNFDIYSPGMQHLSLNSCNIISNFQETYHSIGVFSGCDLNAVNYVGQRYHLLQEELHGEIMGNYLFSGLNNIISNTDMDGNIYSIGVPNGEVGVHIFTTDTPSYYGSSREDIVRKGVWDIEKGYGSSKFDLSNMLTRPNPEAHGIVWKVVVNGYDAQDEFEMLPPLGVGKHKFEVYYSKPVDTTYVPTIAMGVRPPYTQTAIAEEGSWNETGDVYTAYLNLTGKMDIDGLNRIYVEGGKDLEHFDIPLENYRFHVVVNSAGSMSTGFAAEAGLGKVQLDWEAQDEQIDDILGYNLYRYTMVNDSTASDSIRLNQRLIDEPTFTDFDVVPGETYYYYYKIMRTSLTENSPSKVVAATPLTASKGDANGSMTVDVADVVTEISYLTNQNPQPFIFDAADVNTDQAINILDVVGTINLIIHPADDQTQTLASGTAKYTVENDTLYIDTPVALGGVQVSLSIGADKDIIPLASLQGFETVSGRTTADKLTFLAYSMSGRTLAPGRHALLRIGDATIDNLILSSPKGQNVQTEIGTVTGMETIEIPEELHPFPNPFTTRVTIPYEVENEGKHQVQIEIYNAAGHIQAIHTATRDGGIHSYTWDASDAAYGMYFAKVSIDGRQTAAYKLMKAND